MLPNSQPTEVWTIQTAGVTPSARIRFISEAQGWYCELLREGKYYYSRRFLTYAEALAEATAQRHRIERGSLDTD